MPIALNSSEWNCVPRALTKNAMILNWGSVRMCDRTAWRTGCVNEENVTEREGEGWRRAVGGGDEGDLVQNRHLVLDRGDHELLVNLDVGGGAGVLAHGVDEDVVLAELTRYLVHWRSCHVTGEWRVIEGLDHLEEALLRRTTASVSAWARTGKSSQSQA